MTSAFVDDETIKTKYGLTPGNTFEQEFSSVSLENILFEIVAFCIYTLEVLMDLFRADVERRIAETRPHTKDWYRQKALAFLYGYTLAESDIYDTTGSTDAQIEAAKIVTNAAAVKTILSGAGALRLKAVTTIANEYAPLDNLQKDALSEYMNLVSDAGTTVIVTTGPGDDLKLTLDLYYDPLVLAADGSRLDGTDPTPVPNAIKAYLKSIQFNGQLVLSFLENELATVSGVRVPVVKNAWSKYATYAYTDVVADQSAGPIDEIRVADAGYMKLDESQLNINYIPYTE